MNAADRAVVDGWWQHFLATGTLPAGLERVQGRLVRTVYRGQLPSGPVHVKAMTFPRAKDRLRYLLRALPAEHEANLLRPVAAAGIACPPVLDVRVARRWGLPFRSLLVLRTLPVASGAAAAPRERLLAEAAIAQRLLANGIVHRDLHTENFLAAPDGGLAVIDLQSASRRRPAAVAPRALRLATAARLVRERPGLDDAAALSALRDARLLLDDQEVAVVQARLVADRRRFQRTRVWRCLAESTEFTRRLRWSGREYQLRSGLGEGRWWPGGRGLRRAWLGQRVRQLDRGEPLLFTAYFQKWWWLGGSAALYVPARCSGERIPAAVKEATAAWDHFAALP